jgi:hypothetical protein
VGGPDRGGLTLQARLRMHRTSISGGMASRRGGGATAGNRGRISPGSSPMLSRSANPSRVGWRSTAGCRPISAWTASDRALHPAHAAAHLRLDPGRDHPATPPSDVPPRPRRSDRTMRVYQQVTDMGDGGVQVLEEVVGCTLDEAFALLRGRGVLSTNCPPAEQNASQPETWSGLEGVRTCPASGGGYPRRRGRERQSR